jgi:uncharacterized membrane protein
VRRFIENSLRYFVLGLIILALLFAVQTVRGDIPWRTAGEGFATFGRYVLVVAAAGMAVALVIQVLDWLGLKQQSSTPRGPMDIVFGLVSLAVILFFLVRS